MDREDRLMKILEGHCPEPDCYGLLKIERIGGLTSWLIGSCPYSVKGVKTIDWWSETRTWRPGDPIGAVEFKCLDCGKEFHAEQGQAGGWVGGEG